MKRNKRECGGGCRISALEIFWVMVPSLNQKSHQGVASVFENKPLPSPFQFLEASVLMMKYC